MKNGFQKLTAIFMTVLMFLAVIPVSAWGAERYSNSVVPGISVLSILPGDTNTITYIFQKKNGEQTEEIARQIVKKGDTLLEPEVKTGENEKFTGWDPAVTFGTVGEITETKTITVTAKIEKVYYIFFKDNTGRVVATKECTDGQTVSDFSDVTFPVGPDESITGWYFDAANTQKANSVTISGQNVTLYAKVEKGYWITFDANGGSYTAPVFYANGTAAAAPVTNPTLPGYSFDGWYLDKDCTNPANFSEITTSTTVYAGWKAADTTYTVIHWQENADDNGNSYVESETKQGASGKQTAARAKSYLGFTAQSITQETIAGDGSTIVNVYYKRNVYDIKFYERSQNKWNEITSICITAKYGAKIRDKWPTYNNSNTWSTNSDYSFYYGLQGPYQVNIDTMPLDGAKFYGPKTGSGSQTAYYYVEVLPGESGTVYYNGTTYKLDHSDTSPGTGYYVTKEDKYDLTGFTYKEGTENGESYNNAKFYYTRNTYNVVYVSNGETVNTVSYKYEADISNAGDYVPTTAPVGKEDYVFAGWYADPTGQTKYDFTGKKMPAQNITVYAKWVPPTYTVTFYDHDDNQVYALTIAKGAKFDESQVPVITLDEGETFLGWKLQDGTPFNLDTEINRNYDLYAHVGSTKGYRVQYEGGEDTTGAAPLDDTNYAEGSYADVKLPGDLAKADKVFLGWALKEDAQKADYQPGDKLLIKADMDVNGDGVITLYAVWGPKPATTTLTYDANYDGANPKTKLHELEDGTTILPNNAQIKLYGADTFTRPGYELIGWNVDQNAEKPTYQPGDEVIVDNLGENGNVLYAVWKRSVITLTVTKEVTGNFGDKTKLFVIIAKANGANIKRFSLKDKASDAMENFVIGTALTLTEMNPGQGYKVSAVYSYVDENGQTVSTPAMASQDGDDWNLTFGADTLVQNGTITITNEKNTTPDTGVFVDSLPYILIIACVAGAAALFLIRRRKKRED